MKKADSKKAPPKDKGGKGKGMGLMIMIGGPKPPMDKTKKYGKGK